MRLDVMALRARRGGLLCGKLRISRFSCIDCRTFSPLSRCVSLCLTRLAVCSASDCAVCLLSADRGAGLSNIEITSLEIQAAVCKLSLYIFLGVSAL